VIAIRDLEVDVRHKIETTTHVCVVCMLCWWLHSPFVIRYAQIQNSGTMFEPKFSWVRRSSFCAMELSSWRQNVL